MIKQLMMIRKKRTYDNGEMGFSDYVTEYEGFSDFVDRVTGKIKAKTSGKMIDNQLTLEGLFSIVLLCSTDGTTHKFITQSDGYTTAKSPMDMLPLEMDNDLALVDKAIREYYEI